MTVDLEAIEVRAQEYSEDWLTDMERVLAGDVLALCGRVRELEATDANQMREALIVALCDAKSSEELLDAAEKHVIGLESDVETLTADRDAWQDRVKELEARNLKTAAVSIADERRAEAAESKLAVAVDGLERIWNYENSEANHMADCHLHGVKEDPEGEYECDCGYWSTSFPQLKLEARAALAKIAATGAGADNNSTKETK